MDRYLLFITWRGGASAEGLSGLVAENIYSLLERNWTASVNTTVEDFPACSLVGIPGAKGWYFAIQSICGFSQFCSSDWEDINFDLESDKHENSVRRTIEEYLGDNLSTEEEDSCSRESMSLADLYEESAENIHLLTDKLPAPGRAMVDVILQSLESDVPKLKDCLPVIGALKHLKEWHAAKITIVTKESRATWQKVTDYLSADILLPENLNKCIDSKELWRGKIQIWEQKFGSEITFPDYCIKGITAERPLSSLHLNSHFRTDETRETKNTNACVPEVFHYYGSALKFVQLVLLTHIPSPLVSHLRYELSLARTDADEKSLLFWNYISSLRGQVGALFVLPCSVSGMLIPLPHHLSTKKWKEYIAQEPNVVSVPDVDLKGEMCNYYFVVQGNSNGKCTARLIYSADQINGSIALAETTGKLIPKPGQKETGLSDRFLSSLPHFNGEEIIQREKNLARVQALALNHCLKRQKSTQELPVCSADELNCLLTRAREHFLQLWDAKHQNTASTVAVVETKGQVAVCDLELKDSDPSKWPERNVLQNLENFDKIKQKARVSEQLLNHKDGQKGSATSFDAKELLRHFTPEGLPTGNLQPLCIQKSENAFLLTPELTPRKLRSLPFEKVAGCHYHGLEYCLDNRRALERDAGFAELQARLIRYETQTTCTKDSCLTPWALSPAPSPAVLSESGSVPDGESLKKEIQAKSSRLKRRSKDQGGFYPNKRMQKSESADSFLSQASGSSRSHQVHDVKGQSRGQEMNSGAVKHHNWMPKSSSDSQRCGSNPDMLKLTKESRSQKHTRMLKEVVTKTLEKHGVAEDHKCFATCSQRLFEISKCYLKDLKTSRGLFDEMKKAANSNVKQVIEWVLEKTKEK